LQPWGVVGPDDLAVTHLETHELVGGSGVVVEAQDGAVRVGYVQARPGAGLVDAAVRDAQPVASGDQVLGTDREAGTNANTSKPSRTGWLAQAARSRRRC
jgi:hypothetical protein